MKMNNGNAKHNTKKGTALAKTTTGFGKGMPKKKFYAVAIGKKPGVYTSWEDCAKQVNGFPNNKYKGFKTRQEALNYLQGFGGLSNQSKSFNNKRKRETPLIQNSNARLKVEGSSSSNEETFEFIVHFDGGARGNPGVAGAGAEIIFTKTVKKTITKRVKTHIRHFLGDSFTNNQAEYQGLICALENVHKTILEQGQRQKPYKMMLVIQGDSKLIINQMNGIYACKNAKLKPLYAKSKALIESITKLNQMGSCWVRYVHVYREQNKIADGKYAFH